MNIDKYVSSGGTECPLCSSRSLEGGEIDVLTGTVLQNVTCLDCGAFWKDEYKLVGVRVCPDCDGRGTVEVFCGNPGCSNERAAHEAGEFETRICEECR